MNGDQEDGDTRILALVDLPVRAIRLLQAQQSSRVSPNLAPRIGRTFCHNVRHGLTAALQQQRPNQRT